MRTKTGLQVNCRTMIAATLALAASLAHVPAAHAQAAPAAGPAPIDNQAKARGKGIAGGILLGAEAVTIVEALFGVREGWAYVLGGALGAGAGAAAGFALEEKADPEASMALLAGGITLVIPAVVLSLNATRFRGSDDASEDRAPTGPTPEPGQVGGSVVIGGSGSSTTAPAAPSPPPAATPAPPGGATPPPPAPPPQSLLDVREHTGVRVGVPVPQVRGAYSLQQMKELGVPQQTEYRLPVVHVSF